MINSAHFHLIIVHLPIVLFPLASLLLIYQFFYPNRIVKNIACLIIIFSALTSIGAYLSGEEAEELVEHLPGINESTIEEHGDSGEVALWLTSVTGIFALINIFTFGIFNKVSRISMMLLIILSITSSSCLFWVGYLGGQIRHPEAYENVGTEKVAKNEVVQKDHDDD